MSITNFSGINIPLSYPALVCGVISAVTVIGDFSKCGIMLFVLSHADDRMIANEANKAYVFTINIKIRWQSSELICQNRLICIIEDKVICAILGFCIGRMDFDPIAVVVLLVEGVLHPSHIHV